MATELPMDAATDVVLENASFTSHISAGGSAVVVDLEPIAQAMLQPERRSDAGAPSAADGVEAAGISEDVSTTDIVKKFFLVGYPLTLATLAQFSLNLVIILVIGRLLDIEAMGGASLALGLVNATGFAFGAGLCGALETVLSHAYGHFQREEDKRLERAKAVAARTGTEMEPLVPHTLHMYGVYAQRMTIILLVAAVPLGFVLCFADAFLTAIGESASVVHYTGQWCRWAVFGVPSAMAFQLIQRYYSCQHLTKPLPVALFAAAIANPILQYVFVKLFGFAGSPIAWLILMTGTVAGLIFYLRFTGQEKLTWGGWDVRCTQNLGSLVNIALPSMGIMLSGWVALEVNALAGGYGTPAELAAYTITLQVFGVMWAMGTGVMILTCVFVGNAVGEGKPLLARRIVFVAIPVVVSIAAVDVVVCMLLGPFIPSLFVRPEEVKAVAPIYHELMWVVMPYHFFDMFQSIMMAAFRGCKMQNLGALIIGVALCVVGVPLSFLLFFYFKIGIKALWIGPFVGVAVVGTPLYVYILLRYIKWEDLKPHVDGTVAPAEKISDGAGVVSSPVEMTVESAAGTPTAAQVAAVRHFVDSTTPSTTAQRLTATAASTAAAPS
ncbi:membrane transporter protein [Novymonas esmeraldas]|uniref:Membrane transporter protein n=1 Tax=Novymonas esmeraldas TaxID=1808958 RepID=A0AAW0F3T4_9TRYP